MEDRNEVATFGGGCFWCTEAVFAELQGVTSVVPGYAGGHTENPSYREVCSETTGHAEVSRVQFDPARITFKDLLSVFFATHDPTTLNRQGRTGAPSIDRLFFTRTRIRNSRRSPS